MTPEQIHLVKDSWAKVLPVQDEAADLFYHRLFDKYPEVRPYFQGDMKAQGKKLMSMMNTAITNLDNLDTLMGTLKHSGKVHKSYNVKSEDYDKVGEVFLWTLEQELGDAFSPDIKEAWKETYTAVSEVMKEGAQDKPALKRRPTKDPGCRFCSR